MQNQDFIAGLKAKFAEHRIVFWHDPDKRFIEEQEQLELENVTLINMTHASQLAVKKRIEIDEPEQQFLLWFPHDAPPHEQDWLLDIRLYSSEFHADFAAITLNTLGIPQLGLREHIQRRKAFFSTKRTQALKNLVTEQEDEASLDKKMIAVIAGAKTAKTEDILFNLITQYVNQQTEDDSETPRSGPGIVGNAQPRNGLPGRGAIAGKPAPETVLYRSLCPGRPTAARLAGKKCPADAIRQSIRPGIYGDLACRSSL